MTLHRALPILSTLLIVAACRPGVALAQERIFGYDFEPGGGAILSTPFTGGPTLRFNVAPGTNPSASAHLGVVNGFQTRIKIGADFEDSPKPQEVAILAIASDEGGPGAPLADIAVGVIQTQGQFDQYQFSFGNDLQSPFEVTIYNGDNVVGQSVVDPAAGQMRTNVFLAATNAIIPTPMTLRHLSPDIDGMRSTRISFEFAVDVSITGMAPVSATHVDVRTALPEGGVLVGTYDLAFAVVGNPSANSQLDFQNLGVFRNDLEVNPDPQISTLFRARGVQLFTSTPQDLQISDAAFMRTYIEPVTDNRSPQDSLSLGFNGLDVPAGVSGLPGVEVAFSGEVNGNPNQPLGRINFSEAAPTGDEIAMQSFLFQNPAFDVNAGIYSGGVMVSQDLISGSAPIRVIGPDDPLIGEVGLMRTPIDGYGMTVKFDQPVMIDLQNGAGPQSGDEIRMSTPEPTPMVGISTQAEFMTTGNDVIIGSLNTGSAAPQPSSLNVFGFSHTSDDGTTTFVETPAGGVEIASADLFNPSQFRIDLPATSTHCHRLCLANSQAVNDFFQLQPLAVFREGSDAVEAYLPYSRITRVKDSGFFFRFKLDQTDGGSPQAMVLGPGQGFVVRIELRNAAQLVASAQGDLSVAEFLFNTDKLVVEHSERIGVAGGDAFQVTVKFDAATTVGFQSQVLQADEVRITYRAITSDVSTFSHFISMRGEALGAGYILQDEKMRVGDTKMRGVNDTVLSDALPSNPLFGVTVTNPPAQSGGVYVQALPTGPAPAADFNSIKVMTSDAMPVEGNTNQSFIKVGAVANFVEVEEAQNWFSIDVVGATDATGFAVTVLPQGGESEYTLRAAAYDEQENFQAELEAVFLGEQPNFFGAVEDPVTVEDFELFRKSFSQGGARSGALPRGGAGSVFGFRFRFAQDVTMFTLPPLPAATLTGRIFEFTIEDTDATNAMMETVNALTIEATRIDPWTITDIAIETAAAACAADFTGDGFVNGADLATLLSNWGEGGQTDLNNDGFVNGADLAALLSIWGACG